MGNYFLLHFRLFFTPNTNVGQRSAGVSDSVKYATKILTNERGLVAKGTGTMKMILFWFGGLISAYYFCIIR